MYKVHSTHNPAAGLFVVQGDVKQLQLAPGGRHNTRRLAGRHRVLLKQARGQAALKAYPMNPLKNPAKARNMAAIR